ncbi:MAG: dicarboxylate/amino acid:cation symporter [Phycisphaerales bacterium]|nr:MAG: dicarboxylate/amino acid:cation symporter [Phycisphaerales bacterium]
MTTAERRRRKKLAIHWRILIGLILGLVVGLVVNAAWTDATWRGLGVDHPAAFLESREAEVPRLPDGVRTPGELTTGDPALDRQLDRRRTHELTPELIDALGLETVEANQDAGLFARAARFVRQANDFVGSLFLRALIFVAVPIVLFSLVVGAASIGDPAKLGRIGGKTLGIYLLSTAVAITVGLLLANIVGPGGFVTDEVRDQLAERGQAAAADRIAQADQRRQETTGWGTLLNLLPANPFRALAEAQMLQVVVTALLVGLALTRLPEDKRAPVLRVFDGMTDVVIRIVHWIMSIAPYAVFALLVSVVADMGLGVLGALGGYVLVVIAGLAIMMFGVYPGVLRAVAKVGYARFFRAIAPAQLLAFSSSSSGATLPVTMECVEERLGVSEEITSFVIPIGATVNMDGTALYQGVATVFIAQLFGMNLDLGQQLTVVLTATLASIGTAAVPGVGMVMLVIVMQALRFPTEVMTTGVAVIFAVDRVLDMCRTCCNVTGDCMVAGVIAATENELATEAEIAERLQQTEGEA